MITTMWIPFPCVLPVWLKKWEGHSHAFPLEMTTDQLYTTKRICEKVFLINKRLALQNAQVTVFVSREIEKNTRSHLWGCLDRTTTTWITGNHHYSHCHHHHHLHFSSCFPPELASCSTDSLSPPPLEENLWRQFAWALLQTECPLFAQLTVSSITRNLQQRTQPVKSSTGFIHSVCYASVLKWTLYYICVVC